MISGFRQYFTAVIVIFLLSISHTYADEGMWTFDNLPLKTLESRYGFIPTKAWLDHVRLSSVRFSDGGSGSFISPKGLIITNHHVVTAQLQKISTAEHNYLRDGFYAKSLAEEIKCPDLELNVLYDMKNITDLVRKAEKGLPEAEAAVARKKALTLAAKKNMDKTGMRSDVVTLYQGGEYWLYSYKKYRDIRLVFAPEEQIAFFGGDYDNFTYPRYCLDFSIVRAYENGKPAVIKDYLKISTAPIKENELVFISGHPGNTNRQITYSEFLLNRDLKYPEWIKNHKRKIALLMEYSKKGIEQARRAEADIRSLSNTLKNLEGAYRGLTDKRVAEDFLAKETALRKAVEENPELKKEIGDPWGAIEKINEEYKKNFKKINYRILDGELPGTAMILTFYCQEIKKPDGERMEGYHETDIDSLKFSLLSPAPFYKDKEEYIFKDSLRQISEQLGPDDEFVKILLEGKTPEARAKEIIEGTRLDDLLYRKLLLEGGEAALKKSNDPLVQLALKLAPMRREVKKWKELNYTGNLVTASQKIAKAKFLLYGKATYPDATYTLRLSFGPVTGYEYNGTMAPYKTTLYGLYDRYYSFEGRSEWNLPERYIKNAEKLNLSTTFNFISTADVVGGNSGSPVINKNGELVGLIFDGNIESLLGDLIYDEATNRAVIVSTDVIIETLGKIYGAKELLNELSGIVYK